MEAMRIRAQISPLDKSTVVSVFPKKVKTTKVTVNPRKYVVPAGTFEKPSTLVVGTAIWIKHIYETEPEQQVEMPILSSQLADAIVNDFCGNVLSSGHDRRPGLFWVLGEKNAEQVLKEHKKELEQARQNQINWYLELIKMADIDWVKYRGSPLAVSDTARMAAMEMHLDKPWMLDAKNLAMGVCPACGSQRDSKFPVCKECKTIVDKEAYAKLNLTMAG